jgi:hypothetical protein
MSRLGARVERRLPWPARRARFRAWRRRRPFWAGVLTGCAGAEMIWVPLSPPGVMLHMGVGGLSALVIGWMLMAAGVCFWVKPEQRQFVAVVAAAASVVSFITTNFGGFGLGMLLGLLGSSMAFGWRPLPTPPPDDWNDSTPEKPVAYEEPSAEGPVVPARPTRAPATPRAVEEPVELHRGRIVPPALALALALTLFPWSHREAAAATAPEVAPRDRAHLSADTLYITNARFVGVENRKTATGTVAVLHLSADAVKVDNFRSGTVAPPGSNFDATTQLDMKGVDLYLANLSTRVCDPIFGALCIPISITPASPLADLAQLAITFLPGLVVPYIILRDAETDMVSITVDEMGFSDLTAAARAL